MTRNTFSLQLAKILLLSDDDCDGEAAGYVRQALPVLDATHGRGHRLFQEHALPLVHQLGLRP